jgi:hypothetical protein
VFVEDAVGKRHKAIFQGKKGLWPWLNRLAGRK